jgi:hypothetical protein
MKAPPASVRPPPASARKGSGLRAAMAKAIKGMPRLIVEGPGDFPVSELAISN